MRREGTQGQAGHERRKGKRSPPSRVRAFGLSCLLLLLVCWTGCKVTEKNYKFLSTVFDGVPDPSKPKNARMVAGEGGKPVLMVMHKPYKEEKCVDCHGTNDVSRIIGNVPTAQICLKCHEGVPNAPQTTHGPVVAVACLYCHEAHEAREPALMHSNIVKTCTACHAKGLLSVDVPAHAALKESCLNCHFGHGGPNPFMLRQARGSYDPIK